MQCRSKDEIGIFNFLKTKLFTMTLEETLRNDLFDLPVRSSGFFPESTSALLNKYCDLLLGVDDEYLNMIHDHITNIKLTIETINKIVDFVFKGNTIEAYALFSNLIQNLQLYLIYPNKNAQMPAPNYLFKARKFLGEDFGLEDMFHVPFEKRYTIPTSRFSLPGVPCLYLANSIFTCWEELNRPIFQQMAVSRFEIQGKHLRFLDLENDAVFLRRLLSNDEVEIPKGIKKEDAENIKEARESWKELVNFILPRFLNTFPLLAVSYFKVFNPNAHFKPEYVFPQMIMQWVMTTDDINGVKYISTKFKQSKFELLNLEELTNYAIPVRSYKEAGYCDIISESFALTKPISWEIINLIDPSKATLKIDLKNDISGKRPVPPIFQINFINEKPIQYWNTAFGKLEHELSQMPTYRFSDCLSR
jgi:hypothetical protein